MTETAKRAKMQVLTLRPTPTARTKTITATIKRTKTTQTATIRRTKKLMKIITGISQMKRMILVLKSPVPFTPQKLVMKAGIVAMAPGVEHLQTSIIVSTKTVELVIRSAQRTV